MAELEESQILTYNIYNGDNCYEDEKVKVNNAKAGKDKD